MSAFFLLEVEHSESIDNVVKTKQSITKEIFKECGKQCLTSDVLAKKANIKISKLYDIAQAKDYKVDNLIKVLDELGLELKVVRKI